MEYLAILELISKIATVAQTIIPIFAIAHKATTPDASNAALNNASKVISAAQAIIAVGEHAASQAAASGSTVPTGIQKLAVAQAAVQMAHGIVTSSGGTTATFDEVWTPLNAAITAICAAKKATGSTDIQVGFQPQI